MDAKIWAVVIFVWLVVVMCGVGSVFSQGTRFDRRQRLFWILLMIGLPVLGLLVYLPFSIKREGFTLMRQTRTEKKDARIEDTKKRMLKE
ncbi:MAG: hypothetical protein NTZ16_07570 [Verrucomicrobia bacterium]|nr:hypothetical protein [Verrucomicrobiota bacterium]